MKQETVITVSNLTKSFRTRGNKNVFTTIFDPQWQSKIAVKNATFSVRRGESVAFLGPNGAGKTTTTKMMCGLVYPSGGSLEVLGSNPFDREKSFLQRIGLVMGNKAGLNWDLTAEQAFWLLQRIYKIDESDFEKRVDNLTTLLNVKHVLNLQIRRLSLGERMKLELIAAILHEPEILFLDEPTIGLDIESKKAVRSFLRTIQKDYGVTLVLTSHDMDDIEEVCDRVLVINEGEIVFDDSITKITQSYSRKKYVRLHFHGEAPIKQLRTYGTILDDSNGVLMSVSKTKLPKLLAEIPSEHQLEDIVIESVPLETMIADIFAKSEKKS